MLFDAMLFLKMNRKSNKKHWGYTEYDALRFFLDNIDRVISKNLGKITIKLHPTEKKEKYQVIKCSSEKDT